jgi:hypothetical protein
MSNLLSECPKIWQMPNYKKNVASIMLATLFIFLGFGTLNSQQPYLVWAAGYKLSPADYQGAIDYQSSYSASTSYSVSNRWDWLDESALQIEILCRFYPTRSWIKPNATAQLLQHEQIHFDIGEIYARRLRKVLQETNMNAQNCNAMIEQIVQQLRDLCFTRQRAYDTETAHGIITEKQQYWSDVVTQELAELQAYQNPQFVLKLESK